jgi:hypothetical protein
LTAIGGGGKVSTTLLYNVVDQSRIEHAYPSEPIPERSCTDEEVSKTERKLQ